MFTFNISAKDSVVGGNFAISGTFVTPTLPILADHTFSILASDTD
jgi:hypothetical protein